jgi:epoxide hydrolase
VTAIVHSVTRMTLRENSPVTPRPAGTGEIRPFRVAVPQSDVDDLRGRLDRTRWPDELPGIGWDQGVPLGYLKELAEYWRTSYDWREHEAQLNEFRQYTTTIGGQNIHFLHVRSAEPDALPLVITHGWPGSVVEFLKIIQPLTDPRSHGSDPSQAFHLVIPAIPGFGFSGPTTEPGWTTARVAKAWAELMDRLGYRRYGAQGGDWGSGISRDLGITEPDRVVGVHLNTLFTMVPQDPAELADLTETEKQHLERRKRFQSEGLGYGMIQSTRPQTLGYGLTDSPTGQLAWIVEKFKEWTDSADLPDEAVDRDQMLTNVMLYWLTGTATSSARIYYDAARSGAWGAQPRLEVPTGVAVFPKDIGPAIRRFAENDNNIVHWTEFDRGGHFAAMEVPDLLVHDVRAFFQGVR